MALDLWRPRSMMAGGSLGQVSRAEQDMEEMIRRFFGDWHQRGGDARGLAPAVDVLDLKDEVVVRADLPGLEQKDVDVTMSNGTLTIRGERKEDRLAKDEDYYRCERWAGSFARSLSLPPGVDADRARATFKDGLLEVHLHKTRESSSKRIEVKGT